MSPWFDNPLVVFLVSFGKSVKAGNAKSTGVLLLL